MENCPVCRRSEVEIDPPDNSGQEFDVSCPRCGTFTIRKMARFRLEKSSSADPMLSGWLRRQSLAGIEPPVITQENLGEIYARIPRLGITSRTRGLLSAVANLASTPGSEYKVERNKDESLAWAVSSQELQFHLDSLLERGWIKAITKYVDGTHVVSLTPEGWGVVEEGRQATLTRAFVAMSFSESMQEVWADGLRRGISNAGYEPHRVDSTPHIGRIDLKILGDIRQARFVVADATEQKQGVYYEAGFAEVLGKPVIWTVRADEIDKVHFDTRQFAHVLWKTPQDLARQLEGVIVGVIGRGPEARFELK